MDESRQNEAVQSKEIERLQVKFRTELKAILTEMTKQQPKLIMKNRKLKKQMSK